MWKENYLRAKDSTATLEEAKYNKKTRTCVYDGDGESES